MANGNNNRGTDAAFSGYDPWGIFGIGADQFNTQTNTPSTTQVTQTPQGTREVRNAGAQFTSNDPLRGSVFEKGAIFGLDPLGIFDVPQIQTDLERIDPNYLADTATRQAFRNAAASQQLEEQFAPGVVEARREAINQLLADIRGGGEIGGDIESMLMSRLGADTDLGVPELEDSRTLDDVRRRVFDELQLGGQLDPETRNLVAREAAQQASGGGFLGGQIGRDISARDLGLTSMDLRNQRLNRAFNVGQQEQGENIQQQGLKNQIAQANRAFEQQQFGQTADQLQNLRQQEFANRFGTAQFTQGIGQPTGGIDPGDLASFIVGDVNQRNQLVNEANIAQLEAAQAAKGDQLGLFGDIAGGLGSLFCWIARAVYGEDNPKWKEFRFWLLTQSPKWFFHWYIENGEHVAEWIKDKPLVCKIIRAWMDRRIENMHTVDNLEEVVMDRLREVSYGY